ncbi:trypsin-like serine peptidase [Streptacidiphilus cavernicola]|uniref:Serine protease n=1 Tax=Streptacidiphilus cavernicola TaxID=3342716 RepID=A0ABV6W109_9ACTN
MSAARAARPGRTKRRAALGLVLGVLLGGGVFVNASGQAGAASDAAGATAAPATPAATAPAGTAAAGSAAPQQTTSLSPAMSSATATLAPQADAPPITGTGQSITLTAAQQPSQVGALFAGAISDGHHCTASVVDSPAGDVIVTAAHCLSSGASGHVFVPDYRDGTAPYGVWQISQVLEDSAWTSDQDPDSDVAFALVEPLNGQSLESVVGGYSLDTAASGNTTVQITGYPTSTDEPISCTGTSQTFSATQLTVYCTGYANGTSGSGWVENYDPATGTGSLIGVIGGYQTGGDTEDVSYAALFGTTVQTLYNQTVAAAAAG